MSENPIIVKKKKIQAAAHHGGSWKVAYADFVTAMMAFFMVMWILGMSAETRSMVAGYFNDPLGFMKNPPKSKSVFPIPGSPNPKPSTGPQGPAEKNAATEEMALKQVEKEFKETLAESGDINLAELSKHIEVSMDDEGLRIEFQESAGAVFFESGSAVIRPIAKELVGKIGPVLAKSGRPIVVEGHTDAEPFPSQSYTNWDLSNDRAQSLGHALMATGVPYKQFAFFAGYAETRLKNPAEPTHFSNRRVTLLLPYKRVLKLPENLPADALKGEIQGVFKKEIGISPTEGSAGKPEKPFWG